MAKQQTKKAAQAKTISRPMEGVGRRSEFTSQEGIAKLAYHLWQGRGCPEGSSDEDWFNAERILKGGVGSADATLTARGKSEIALENM